MKTFASLFVLLVAPVVCGLGFVWDVETTRPQPYDAQAFHGETFELAATFKERGAQLSDGAATAQLYYQSPEMASTEWYSASATFDATTATVRATWSPALDTGAKSYRFFLAVETSVGANYRAYGTLRLKDSPGFNPTLLEPIDVREEIIADILEDVKVWAAPAEHTHAISEIDNLQSSLDSKAGASHKHAISDVTNLQSTLNNKANTSHTHSISNVSGLEDKLDYMLLRSRSTSDLKTNFITSAEAPIQFYGRTGDTMLPIFAMGSQLKAGDPNNIKLFNWVSFWFYDRIEFLEGNGTARIPYRFTANHGDRSEVIARIKDLPVIDTALSATSTNPVQNKAIMSQMMIFSSVVDSVQSSLDSKADASHTHAIADISGLQTALDAAVTEETDPTISAWAKATTKPTYTWTEITEKPEVFTPEAHAHAIADVSGLQTALDAAVTEETDPTISAWAKATTKPTYTWTEITEKPEVFTPEAHAHAIADVSGLQTALDAAVTEETDPTISAWAKATTKPTYTWTEITEKPEVFTPEAHEHAIADVSGLQTALDAKQPALTAGENITISGNVISAKGGSVTPTMETATWSETICSIAWSSHPLTVDFNGQNATTANVQFPTDAWPEGAARMIFFKTSGITNTYNDALSEVCFDDADGCLSVEFIGYEYLEAEAVHHATAYRFGDVLYISIVARRYIETEE
ncbi:MAG: hypothetical protein Q4F99_02905 [bacterium]|nr:hypothetical protein [bacterium]